jgi:hypothetical protein
MKSLVALGGILLGFVIGFVWGIASLRFFSESYVAVILLFLLPIASIIAAWVIKSSTPFYKIISVSMLAGSVSLLIMLLSALSNFT